MKITRIIQRVKNGLPKHIKNVWWNRSVHMNEKYPIVRWEKIGYLNCEKGLVVPMEQLPSGRYAYYEVIKTHKSRGGDWLYPSDAINCDLKFHSIRKELGIGGYQKKKDSIHFVEHTP